MISTKNRHTHHQHSNPHVSNAATADNSEDTSRCAQWTATKRAPFSDHATGTPQVIGNDPATAWRSQTQPFNEGDVSTDYRPRPGAAPTAVMEDLATPPPVAACPSPSLRSTIDTALVTRSLQSELPNPPTKLATAINAIPPEAVLSVDGRKQRRCVEPNRKTEFHGTASVWVTDAGCEVKPGDVGTM